MQAVLYARLFENDSGVLKLVVSASISMLPSPLLIFRPGRAGIVSVLLTLTLAPESKVRRVASWISYTPAWCG